MNGKWPTIIASGLVFAALHFRFGVASPDNAIAGFVLAWAYIKSESILVPITLHALGNLAVGLYMLAAMHAG